MQASGESRVFLTTCAQQSLELSHCHRSYPVGLFALEGWTTEVHLDSPQVRPEHPCQRDFDSIRDHEELRHAEQKGHYLYNRSKEVILRLQVARGLLGAGKSTT